MDADRSKSILPVANSKRSQQQERTPTDPRRLVHVRSAGHGLFSLAAFAFCAIGVTTPCTCQKSEPKDVAGLLRPIGPVLLGVRAQDATKPRKTRKCCGYCCSIIGAQLCSDPIPPVLLNCTARRGPTIRQGYLRGRARDDDIAVALAPQLYRPGDAVTTLSVLS
jgi:hypothetical protein